MPRLIALCGLLVVLACDPGFSRPNLRPGPEAPHAEVRGDVANVTTRIAEALEAEGIPVEQVNAGDGWLRTAWLDTAGFRPVAATARGLDAVRVRGWIDPASYGTSRVTLEGVWRPLADPSLPERELERALPAGHPGAVRIQRALDRLTGAAIVPAGPPPAPAPR
jgi:hypothetical protein